MVKKKIIETKKFLINDFMAMSVSFCYTLNLTNVNLKDNKINSFVFI